MNDYKTLSLVPQDHGIYSELDRFLDAKKDRIQAYSPKTLFSDIVCLYACVNCLIYEDDAYKLAQLDGSSIPLNQSELEQVQYVMGRIKEMREAYLHEQMGISSLVDKCLLP